MYERFIQGYLSAQWDHLEEYMPFRVNNQNGEQVAVYANRSEAETYFRASFANAQFDDSDYEANGVVAVHDGQGNDLGEIVGPKPQRRSETPNGGESPPNE